MPTFRLLGLSPVLLCIAAAPASDHGQALAQANASAVQAAPASATAQAKVEEPKICKQLPSSYSRLPDRACLTKKQWEQLKKEQDQD